MVEEFAERSENASVHAVGLQLRAAREEKGMTLEEVSAETRIPKRHLVAIEEGDFTSLPARTYAIGFSKTYAKVVGLDQDDVAALVRAELDAQEPARPHRPATFEPGDPARVPSARLAWFAAIAVLLLLAGGFFYYRSMFTPAAELPPLTAQEDEGEGEELATQEALVGGPVVEPAQTAAASGPVVFTALEDRIWVRFYDANGQLMEKVMSEGETYTVPANAEEPQLWTGRPDALGITVGGREVPRLSEDDQVMRDVLITPEALLRRGQEQGAAATAVSPAT